MSGTGRLSRSGTDSARWWYGEEGSSARRGGVEEREEGLPAQCAAGRDGARARYESEEAPWPAPEPAAALEAPRGWVIEQRYWNARSTTRSRSDRRSLSIFDRLRTGALCSSSRAAVGAWTCESEVHACAAPRATFTDGHGLNLPRGPEDLASATAARPGSLSCWPVLFPTAPGAPNCRWAPRARRSE